MKNAANSGDQPSRATQPVQAESFDSIEIQLGGLTHTSTAALRFPEKLLVAPLTAEEWIENAMFHTHVSLQNT